MGLCRKRGRWWGDLKKTGLRKLVRTVRREKAETVKTTKAGKVGRQEPSPAPYGSQHPNQTPLGPRAPWDSVNASHSSHKDLAPGDNVSCCFTPPCLPLGYPHCLMELILHSSKLSQAWPHPRSLLWPQSSLLFLKHRYTTNSLAQGGLFLGS